MHPNLPTSRTSSAGGLLNAILMVVLSGSAPALAQCPGVWASGSFSIGDTGMNNTVNAVATALDNSIYAAGVFSSADGTAVSNVARWNGLWAPLGTGLNSTAYAAAIASNGDLIVAGQFTTAGGIAANRIARWNGSSWSAIGTGFDSTVFALAIKPNNEIVAAGSFTTAGGGAANRVARWNGSTWIPLGNGLNNQVNALAILPNGDVIAGGIFTASGGTTVSSIARFDGNTADWQPLPGLAGEGTDGRVRSLAAMNDGSVVVGGLFGLTGGTLNSFNVARWSPAGGGTWSAMGSGLSSECWALRVLPSGTLMAGGDFNFDGSGVTALNHVSRWSGTGWQPVGAGTNNRVRCITATNLNRLDTFYACGEFTTAGGNTANRVAQFDASATPTILFQPAATAEKCGSTARFFTLAGPAPVSYQWRRNGVNLADGGAISGATSTVLTINPVAAANAGSYDCVVSWPGACSATTTAASLTTSGCCPADFDNSGAINPADVAAFVNAWFASLTAGC